MMGTFYMELTGRGVFLIIGLLLGIEEKEL